MTDSTETKTVTSKSPSHYAYNVRNREGGDNYWIWLEFPKASHRAAANTLFRLGFHWNQRRCVWQHPCGACAPYAAHPADPRIKYGSYFAADRVAA